MQGGTQTGSEWGGEGERRAAPADDYVVNRLTAAALFARRRGFYSIFVQKVNAHFIVVTQAEAAHEKRQTTTNGIESR